MFIPITNVKKILDVLIALIKADYDSAIQRGQETESFLYRVLYGNALGDYDFYVQGVQIFTRTPGSSRQIQTRMGFDLGQSSLPTIYVHQPNEVMKGVNTIGWGMDTNEFYLNADGTTIEKLFRGFGSTFEYVITSPSVLETLLVYEVLHAALSSSIDTFMAFFNNVSFTGKELIAKNELMPEPIFIKSIQLEVDYVKQVPQLMTNDLITLLEFEKAKVYSDEAIGDNIL